MIIERLNCENSSLLKEVTYTPLYHTLKVIFLKSDKEYTYKGITDETWDELKNSGSKGSYFATFIKGKHFYEVM